MDLIEIDVEEDSAGRLDNYISNIIVDKSRTYINKLIKDSKT